MGSVIGLIGSPRKDGRTALIVRYALQLLDNAGFQTKEVSFSDIKITPCGISCDYNCSHRPISCPVNDDVPKIYDLIKNSDLVVVGCPAYGGLLLSIMYAFKERAQGLAEDWPLIGKEVILFLNCNTGCERPMYDLEKFFGCGGRIVEKTIISNPHSKEKISPLTNNDCKKVKKTLFLYLGNSR